jgi:hypothetical protein
MKMIRQIETINDFLNYKLEIRIKKSDYYKGIEYKIIPGIILYQNFGKYYKPVGVWKDKYYILKKIADDFNFQVNRPFELINDLEYENFYIIKYFFNKLFKYPTHIIINMEEIEKNKISEKVRCYILR